MNEMQPQDFKNHPISKALPPERSPDDHLLQKTMHFLLGQDPWEHSVMMILCDHHGFLRGPVDHSSIRRREGVPGTPTGRSFRRGSLEGRIGQALRYPKDPP